MSQDKLFKLLQIADKKRSIAALHESLDVQEFFSRLEERLINDMATGALVLTTDQLRAIAVALDTTRKLRAFLKAAAGDAKRAEQDYAKLTGAKQNV